MFSSRAKPEKLLTGFVHNLEFPDFGEFSFKAIGNWKNPLILSLFSTGDNPLRYKIVAP